ncbi:Transposase IS200 like protein [Opitutaceae bacterium TAV1]|nr:Transposase IS200 like protein [Opitutaceae bacterium TAV1]
MRTARVKEASEKREAVYHCMSRTVNGERLFGEAAREVFRKQMWQVADFCGVEIITWTILSNHFHVLVRVPRKTAVDDNELLRRYRVLYPKPTPYQTARLEVVRQWLTERENLAIMQEAEAWRVRQVALMGDVSQFMKLLKQRFSIWFNRTHNRFGTLWCERFKSVLVEPRGRVLETMAAYIDLNCIRAGLAADPAEYRFCGYAEAVAGHERARAGLVSVVEGNGWRAVQAGYRQMLFGKGAGPQDGKGEISEADLERVMEEKGQLPLATVLRHRIRYFSEGVVLGSKVFVAGYVARHERRRKARGLLRRRKHRHDPVPLPPLTDWGAQDLATLRKLRRTTI